MDALFKLDKEGHSINIQQYPIEGEITNEQAAQFTNSSYFTDSDLYANLLNKPKAPVATTNIINNHTYASSTNSRQNLPVLKETVSTKIVRKPPPPQMTTQPGAPIVIITQDLNLAETNAKKSQQTPVLNRKNAIPNPPPPPPSNNLDQSLVSLNTYSFNNLNSTLNATLNTTMTTLNEPSHISTNNTSYTANTANVSVLAPFFVANLVH